MRISSCFSSADQLSAELDRMFRMGHQEYIEPEDITASFCQLMQNNTPSHCNQLSRYFTGEFTLDYLRWNSISNPTTWSIPSLSNGCGTGSTFELIAAEFGSHILTGWSGSINEPIAGFSFLSACNNHDVCYANQSGQGECDTRFFRQMESVCESDNSDKCMNAAHLYRAAVGSKAGEVAYKKAGRQKECRAIQRDHQNNNCPAN